MILLSDFSNAIVTGVLGSFIASVLTFITVRIFNEYHFRIIHAKFSKLFGKDNNEILYLVVPALSLTPEVTTPFPLRNFAGSPFRSSKLLAYADTTSFKYINDVVAVIKRNKTDLITDEDLQKKLDLSFVSFGGSSFYCDYVLRQHDNTFYRFDNGEILSLSDNQKFTNTPVHDVGFIIKYRHPNFQDRVWIIIAGLGESGTRGAGWYLSKNWKSLADQYGDKSFGLVVRVDHGVDHSAIKVHPM